MQHDGNAWVRCGQGHRHWGRFGAAGLLLADRHTSGGPAVLLQNRAAWTANGDTWGLPGGARDSHETSVQAALREAAEETGVQAGAARILGELVDDHGATWAYTTVIAELTRAVELLAQAESQELRWVGVDQVDVLELQPRLRGHLAAVAGVADGAPPRSTSAVVGLTCDRWGLPG